MTTVGDYTFVVNKTKTVSMSGATSTTDTSRTKSGLVEVLVGQYSRDYTVTVSVNNVDFSVTHSTDASTATNAEEKVATDYIAEKLETALATVGGYFTISRVGSSIRLTPLTANLNYSITTSDGLGGGAMRAVTKHTVGSFEKLPVKAKNGDIYKVEGGVGSVDEACLGIALHQ